MNVFETHSEPLPRRVATGLAKISLALRSRAWREAGGRGLTPTQGQILERLRARHPQAQALNEVAAALAVKPATVSEAVATLERKRLLTKGRASADARRLRLRLTAAGLREARRASVWSDFLGVGIEALSGSEQEAFLRGLIKMVRVLQERGDIPVARMCVNCRYFRPHAHRDPERPHHCEFVGEPFGDRHLRLECPEHVPAGSAQADTLWRAFTREAAAAPVAPPE
jgi:DNA-binding MarR family transcriptional regulator